MPSNKIALVTGASSGIGQEIAKVLASRKIDLVLVSRSLDKLKLTGEALEKEFGIRAYPIAADLSQAGEAEKLFENCEKKGLKIDYLINNAGTGLFGDLFELNLTDIDKMLVLNIQSLTDLCTLFGRDMAERGGGYILNIGSLVGRMPVPYFASYAASKSYVISYSLSIRQELKKKGVFVSCLMPGFVRTNFDKAAGVESGRYSAVSKMSGMNPQQVAKIGVKLMFSKRALRAAGLGNRFASLALSLLPKTFLAWLLKGGIGLLK